MRKIMRKYSIGSPDPSNTTTRDVIEFEALIDLLRLFKFNCGFADRNELRTYFFNTGLIEESLRQHRLQKDKIYLDCELLFDKIKACYKELGFKD